MHSTGAEEGLTRLTLPSPTHPAPAHLHHHQKMRRFMVLMLAGVIPGSATLAVQLMTLFCPSYRRGAPAAAAALCPAAAGPRSSSLPPPRACFLATAPAVKRRAC